MNRRAYPKARATETAPSNYVPALGNFETYCLQNCGAAYKAFDSNTHASRTIIPFKMDADVSGTATMYFNISFGKARIRILTHPDGVNQVDGPNVYWDSQTQRTTGSFNRNITADVPYIFVDILQKEDAEGSVSMNCYQNTSVVSNPEPYYPETIDDNVTVQENSTVEIRCLDNDIRKDLLSYPTLRIKSIANGSAVVNPAGYLVFTAPDVGPGGASFPIEYAIKDGVWGLEHCGTITVNVTEGPVTDVYPQAIDDEYDVESGATSTFDVLSNDYNEQMFAGTLRIVFPPAKGSLTLNDDDTFNYVAPSVTADEVDSFVYGWRAYNGQEYTATVTINLLFLEPPAALATDTWRIPLGQTNSIFPLTNDDTYLLDLSTFRKKPGFVDRVNNLTTFVDLKRFTATGASVGTSVMYYQVDDYNGVTYEGTINIEVYSTTQTQPVIVAPDIHVWAQPVTPGSPETFVPHLGTFNYGKVQKGTFAYTNFYPKNKGNGTLYFNNGTATGNFSGANYSGQVQPGQMGNTGFAMDTSTVGLKTGTLTINSNDPDTPVYTIYLRGEVVDNTAPGIKVIDALSFEEKADGSTQRWQDLLIGEGTLGILQIQNNGNANLVVSSASVSGQFSASSFSGTITPGSSRNINITPNTSTAGTKTGALTIQSNDASNPTYVVNLSAVVKASIPADPQIRVLDITNNLYKPNYSQLDFGSLANGTPFLRTVRIYNNGGQGLIITNATSNGDYTSPPLNTTIAAGGFTDLQITMDTASDGGKTGVLTIPSNDPINPTFELNLIGTVFSQNPQLLVKDKGLDTVISSGYTKGFSAVEVDQYSARVFSLTNIGDVNLNVSSIPITGNFSTSSSVSTIYVGQTVDILVLMDTATQGSKTGVLTINSNDPDFPAFAINLQGSVIVTSPKLVVFDAQINKEYFEGDTMEFYTKELNETEFRYLQIINNGNADLNVSSIVVGGNYTAPSFSGAITPGNSHNLLITMDTTTVGTKTGTVTINSDNPDDASVVINLNGNVFDPNPAEPAIAVFETTDGLQIEMQDFDSSGWTNINNIMYDFGDHIPAPSNPTKRVTIRNVGDADLDVNAYISNGGNLGSELPPVAYLSPGFNGTIQPGFSVSFLIEMNLMFDYWNYEPVDTIYYNIDDDDYVNTKRREIYLMKDFLYIQHNGTNDANGFFLNIIQGRLLVDYGNVFDGNQSVPTSELGG